MSEQPTPYTLNEFDIVLSVSEAALNAQFMHLFLTELPPPLGPDGKAVDPPPPVPGQPEPEKEYLISPLDVLVYRNEKDTLGEGGFGTVYRGSYHGAIVAVKELQPGIDKKVCSSAIQTGR